jgi:imidazolonepropionase-like amidohydrolase
MRRAELAVTAAMALAACILATCRPPTPARDGFAIVGAAVLDGTGGPAIEDAIVVVEDAQVRAVGPRAMVAIPKGLPVIDGRGRWVMSAVGKGILEPGQSADLLLLDADPRADPGAAGRARHLDASGRILGPAAAGASSASP